MTTTTRPADARTDAELDAIVDRLDELPALLARLS